MRVIAKRRGVWALLAVVGLAVELRALNDATRGDTLSATTRILFRTDTKPGQLVWLAFWIPFSVWFGRHIHKYTNPVPSN